MPQTTIINQLSYAKATVNQDLRNVKVAARPAVQSFEPVVLSQLTDYLDGLSNQLSTQIAQEANNRTTSDSIINSLIASNFTSLTEAIQGVNNKETVAARVLTYGELAAPITGIDYTAAIDSYRRWVLVDDELDTTQNGIYYQQETGTPNVYTAVRVPDWSTADDFAAGLEVFVDSGPYQNTVYWVFDSAVIGEDNGFSVGFIPWQRPEFIQIDSNLESGFLSKIGNKIRAEIDNTYFRVVNGSLTWSAALVAWKGTVDSALLDIAQLQTTVLEQGSEIESLNSTVTGQTLSISTLSTDSTALRTDVGLLQNADSAQDGRLDGIEALNIEQNVRLTSAETVNSGQDTRLGLIESVNLGQDNRLETIESVNTEQNTRLGSVETVNTQQNVRLDTIEQVNNSQDERLTSVETVNVDQSARLISVETVNSTQDTRLGLIESVNSDQDSRLEIIESVNGQQSTLITGLRTDTDVATSKNNEQDTRLDIIEATSTSLQSQVSALPTNAVVDNTVLNFLRASSIRAVLTDGTDSLVDGIHQTVFDVDVTAQIAILGPGAAYRLTTLNDAATPYTQSAQPVVTYPNLNTVSIMMQSYDSAVPDDTVEVSLHAFFLITNPVATSAALLGSDGTNNFNIVDGNSYLSYQ